MTDPRNGPGIDGTPEWAYDEDGYCVACGYGRWKNHGIACELRDALDRSRFLDPTRDQVHDAITHGLRFVDDDELDGDAIRSTVDAVMALLAPCSCGPIPNDGRYDDPACPHHGHPEGGVSSVTEAPPREDVVVRLQDAVAAAHYSGASSVTVDLPTGDDLLRLLAAAGPMPEEVAELDRLYTETKQRLLRLVAENWGSDFTNPEIGGCMAECAYLDAAELAGWLAEHISEMCDHRPAAEAPQPRVLYRGPALVPDVRSHTFGVTSVATLKVPPGSRVLVVEDPAGAEEADDAPG